MAREAVAFVSTLREAGVAVPTDSSVLFAEALTLVDPYWAGRATLVRRPEDIPTYDAVYTAYPFWPWQRPSERTLPGPEREVEVAEVRWSRWEVLRHKDLAECTPAERDEAMLLMRNLGMRQIMRRSRRRRPDPHDRGQLDLRRTMQRSMRTGGEIVRPLTTRQGDKPRRLLLVVDVSGSMEPYARALLRLAHAAVAGRCRRHVEAFALGTRVTRLTRELSSHDPDEALARAGRAIPDWAGGTRLGEGMRELNDRWAAPGAGRGAVVVILSDGWDRGDPSLLGHEMERLQRLAHKVVWVNPLKASPGYEPLAGGMAAALPHVDEFVEGHSVASLEALAQVMGAPAAGSWKP